ncbi:MAG: non-ribosomal peptide synthetase, partial [Planctomycetes bacterium]|nr:non-ribosomal peptide synthetase [Planctomycetota bacterium]
PASRLATMIADCQMPLLITESSLAASLPATKARVVTLDSLLAVGAAGSPKHNGHARPAFRGHRLAYIIYTSGSTGVPKGVMVPQRAVVNFLASMAQAPGLTAGDAMLAATTVSFDIAVLELFLPLTVGAKVVLADRETATDGRALANFARDRGVTAMQGTPATYRMLLAGGWRPPPSMKLLVGGEALTGGLAAQLLREDVELWNMYGPTETTVWSAVHRVTGAEDPISIGRPIANTQIYILDAHGEPAPRGAVGELCIGGIGVAAGYWKRPELTAERFLSDPFAIETISDGACPGRPGAQGTSSADPHAGQAPPLNSSQSQDDPPRMYKTGDLARWRSDGTLEFLGRADAQVKVRGFRIELGEIEAALAAHPRIREAAVTAPADRSGERRLIAYFASSKGAAPTAEELRRHLQQSLPAYMLPAAFIAIPEIPHTPAGKIDRRSLPAPEGESFAASAPFVAPRTPLEEKIAAAWREVLGVERVGVEDSFFELGGHSLLAARLFSRLRDQLQAELPLRDFYERPTVAAVAETILRLRAENDSRGMQDMLDRLEGMSDEEAAALPDNLDS